MHYSVVSLIAQREAYKIGSLLTVILIILSVVRPNAWKS